MLGHVVQIARVAVVHDGLGAEYCARGQACLLTALDAEPGFRRKTTLEGQLARGVEFDCFLTGQRFRETVARCGK